MFNFFKRSDYERPELSLEGINLNIKNITGAIEIVYDFPRVDWSKVRAAVQSYSNHPAIDLLWTELAAQWLGAIRRYRNEGYQIYEGKHLLLLSAQDSGAAARLASLGDEAYERLEHLLNRPMQERGLGKHAVLVLESTAGYYDYVSHFHAEKDRERATSAGVHIKQGYRHTVINGRSKTILRTLVHELAHDMVTLRPLPLWLNEGLAQWSEDMVPGYRAPLINSRQARLHRRYWSWFGMDHFWDGSSFSNVSSQRISYQLSDILFRNLVNHPSRSKHLSEFLATADRKDAGSSGCMQCFGCPLSVLVEQFLGPGPWQPKAKLE